MTILSLVGAASSAASLEYKIVFEMLGELLPSSSSSLLLQSLPLRLSLAGNLLFSADGVRIRTVPQDWPTPVARRRRKVRVCVCTCTPYITTVYTYTECRTECTMRVALSYVYILLAPAPLIMRRMFRQRARSQQQPSPGGGGILRMRRAVTTDVADCAREIGDFVAR